VIEARPKPASGKRTPAHASVVGLLLVLWNGWGLALAIAGQTDSLPGADAQMAAYFDTQPLWLVLFANLGPLAGIAGAVALLLQSRWATVLFVMQVTVIVIANLYEVLAGTSPLLVSDEARIGTLVLAVVMAGQIFYARYLQRRGVLY
jgi:hypothetical protein